jgi:hypothetical protein
VLVVVVGIDQQVQTRSSPASPRKHRSWPAARADRRRPSVARSPTARARLLAPAGAQTSITSLSDVAIVAWMNCVYERTLPGRRIAAVVVTNRSCGGQRVSANPFRTLRSLPLTRPVAAHGIAAARTIERPAHRARRVRVLWAVRSGDLCKMRITRPPGVLSLVVWPHPYCIGAGLVVIGISLSRGCRRNTASVMSGHTGCRRSTPRRGRRSPRGRRCSARHAWRCERRGAS